jgi:probable HAF family extracellular repeat protein
MLEDLGDLGGSAVWAYGLNDGGEVVGQARRGSFAFAFRFTGHTLADMGTPPGGSSSTACAINNAGQIAGSSDTTGGALHAFLFEGGFRDLGTLGGISSEAHAVNERGQVVGTSYPFSNDRRHAFLYSDGRMEDLGTLGGDFSAAYGIQDARAINDVGQIAGTGRLQGHTHAFLLTPIPTESGSARWEGQASPGAPAQA